ncbi:MAG: hypothetical protein GY751_03870 [Bacteroidetes bacterium]|nr:hypothetical protein [Bacteroidota bacterium]
MQNIWNEKRNRVIGEFDRKAELYEPSDIVKLMLNTLKQETNKDQFIKLAKIINWSFDYIQEENDYIEEQKTRTTPDRYLRPVDVNLFVNTFSFNISRLESKYDNIPFQPEESLNIFRSFKPNRALPLVICKYEDQLMFKSITENNRPIELPYLKHVPSDLVNYELLFVASTDADFDRLISDTVQSNFTSIRIKPNTLDSPYVVSSGNVIASNMPTIDRYRNLVKSSLGVDSGYSLDITGDNSNLSSKYTVKFTGIQKRGINTINWNVLACIITLDPLMSKTFYINETSTTYGKKSNKEIFYHPYPLHEEMVVNLYEGCKNVNPLKIMIDQNFKGDTGSVTFEIFGLTISDNRINRVISMLTVLVNIYNDEVKFREYMNLIKEEVYDFQTEVVHRRKQIVSDTIGGTSYKQTQKFGYVSDQLGLDNSTTFKWRSSNQYSPYVTQLLAITKKSITQINRLRSPNNTRELRDLNFYDDKILLQNLFGVNMYLYTVRSIDNPVLMLPNYSGLYLDNSPNRECVVFVERLLAHGGKFVYAYDALCDTDTDTLLKNLMRKKQTYYITPENETLVNCLDRVNFKVGVKLVTQSIDKNGHITDLKLTYESYQYHLVFKYPLLPFDKVDIGKVTLESYPNKNQITNLFGHGKPMVGRLSYDFYDVLTSDMTTSVSDIPTDRHTYDTFIQIVSLMMSLITWANSNDSSDQTSYKDYFTIKENGSYNFDQLPLVLLLGCNRTTDINYETLKFMFDHLDSCTHGLIENNKIVIYGKSMWDKLDNLVLSHINNMKHRIKTIKDMLVIKSIKNNISSFEVDSGSFACMSYVEYMSMISNSDYDQAVNTVKDRQLLSNEPFYYISDQLKFLIQPISYRYSRTNQVPTVDSALEVCHIWIDENYNPGPEVIPSKQWHKQAYYRLFAIDEKNRIYYHSSYNADKTIDRPLNILAYIVDGIDNYMALLELA